MSLLNPWLLLGALGAAVPVLLHLYGRRRARRVPFPSLMLIQQAQRERSALMRVRQLLLMALRALAILLLSLALAQPVVRWWTSPPETTVLAVDDSLSMRATSVRSIEQWARERAGQASRATVVSLSDLRDHDAPAPAEYGALDLRERLSALRERYRGVADATALQVATDLQETSWLGGTAVTPDLPAVTIFDRGRQTDNSSALRIELVEPPALVGFPAQVLVTVRGSAAGRALPVRLFVNDTELPPAAAPVGAGPTQALFEWTPRTAGPARLRAVLPADGLSEDNECYAVVQVRRRLEVLVLGAQPAERLAALALAPSAAGPMQVQQAAAVPAALDHDVAVVAELPREADLERLRRAVQNGMGLVVMTERLGAKALTLVSGVAARFIAPGAVNRAATVGHLDVFRPPLRAFGDPAAGDLGAVEVQRAPELQPDSQGDARVLAEYDDGSPAIVEGHLGRGRVVLLNLPLDPKLSNLSRQPVFVPLMHRLVKHVAPPPDPLPQDALVRQPVALTGSKRLLGCVGPDGQPVPVTAPDGRQVIVPRRPGFHSLTWSEGGRERTAPLAVNLDPAETDLRRADPAGLARELRGANIALVTGSASPPPAGLPARLAAPLLILALLLLLAELALSHGIRMPFPRPRGSR